MLVSALKVACFFMALFFSAYSLNNLVVLTARSRHDKTAKQDTGLLGTVILWTLFYATTLMGN